ncbi:MAG: hypothetical protein ACT4P7_04970 [Gemmatimonadaceae bacterium]
MDKYEAIVAIVSIVFGSLTAIAVTFGIAHALGKWRKGDPAVSAASVARLEQRMERIEQAIDAVAVEMERVSEGQRFATRLLSERAGEKTSA